jgi:hypothetical protein
VVIEETILLESCMSIALLCPTYICTECTMHCPCQPSSHLPNPLSNLSVEELQHAFDGPVAHGTKHPPHVHLLTANTAGPVAAWEEGAVLLPV